jgi:hypothetical protein
VQAGRNGAEAVEGGEQLFRRSGCLEVDFLAGATALEGLLLAAADDHAKRKGFDQGEQSEITENAEGLLPGTAFHEETLGAFWEGLLGQEVFTRHDNKFVIAWEIVDEADYVTFHVIAIAKKYKAHIRPYLELDRVKIV